MACILCSMDVITEHISHILEIGKMLLSFDIGFSLVNADVVLLHGCPQSCMLNPIESLLEVCADMVDGLLVLEMFLTKDSWVQDLLCGALSCSEAGLFFSDIFAACDFSVSDMKHDFAWMADEADHSIFLALLQVVFRGKCDVQGP